MKKIILAFSFILIVVNLFAQIDIDTCTTNSSWGEYFNGWEEFVIIDTVNNPDNSWQVGSGTKEGLDIEPPESLYSEYMITDTFLPYPTNDTSSFILPICHAFGDLYPGTTIIELEVDYYMDSDTLNDFGKIEVSIDQGLTWWDILNPDYDFWPTGDIILTGNSGTFRKLKFLVIGFGGPNDFMDHWSELHDMQADLSTVIVRFTFTSDAIADNKLGWMISNIEMEQGIFSNVEQVHSLKSTIRPNPVRQTLNIEIEEENNTRCHLNIISIDGRSIFQQTIENSNITNIDVGSIPPGIYQCLIENEDRTQRSIEKIVIQH